jgi:hypothetical protein
MPSKLRDYAMVAEIASAIAVVVSVLYLGKQINDNTRLLRSQAHYNALSLAQRPLEMMVQDESLAQAVTRCDSDPDAAQPAEWARCGNYYFMQFNAWEYMYYQNADGSIPRQLWNGADVYFKEQLKTKPGYTRFWNELSGAFDEPFRSYAAAEFARRPAAARSPSGPEQPVHGTEAAAVGPSNN